MSWFGLVIVWFLIIQHVQSWSIIHPVRKSNDKSGNSVNSHGEIKEDWETKGKILYAKDIIPTTTVSLDAVATTIDEISEDENEVNSTIFTLFSLNTTEKSEWSTCSEAQQLTTQLTSDYTELGPEIPDKETEQGANLTKTRISYHSVGLLGKNKTKTKKFKYGFFSNIMGKKKQNEQEKSTDNQEDISEEPVTTAHSIKRSIRSLHQADKTKDCNELHSHGMQQLYSALMADNFDPNKKKRENERNSHKSTSDFMSEGFWETPMTKIIGTGVDDVKVQFATPIVNNLNSLNQSGSDRLMRKDQPLQIISNEDHDKNIKFFEDTKQLKGVNKNGYYKSSTKKKSGELDLEQMMNWPISWYQQNKKVYSSEQSKKILQKWGKLAGKLKPIWDAIDEGQVELTTEFKAGRHNSLITYESKNLPLNKAEKYKSQQISNLEILDSIKKTNEMQCSNMNMDSGRLQSNEKSSGWKEKNQPKKNDLLVEAPMFHLQKPSTQNDKITKVESSDMEKGDKLNGERLSIDNFIAQKPPSNGFDGNNKTDELINPSSNAAQSKWESSAGQNHKMEFPNLPNLPVELQQLLNERSPIVHRKVNKKQNYRQEPNLSIDEFRSKWELPQFQRPKQKWERDDLQEPTRGERPSNWDRTNVNIPEVLQSSGEIDDEQNKLTKEQQPKWENIEIDDAQNKLMKELHSKSDNSKIEDAYNNFLKQHQSKWETIEVVDPINKFTKGHQSNAIWELPNIIDPSSRKYQFKLEPSDMKNPQENIMQWKLDKNAKLREYKQIWGSPTIDDPLLAEPNPSMWQTPNFQNQSESMYRQKQVPFVGDGSLSKLTQLQNPTEEFPSKWQEPAYYNPSEVVSNNVPGFVRHQDKWSNLQCLSSKDLEIERTPNAMLNELSVQPNFDFLVPQNYKESQQNLRTSMGIIAPNSKWANVHSQTCSLTDDSLPIKGSNLNDQTSKEVTSNQTYLTTKSEETVMSPGKMFKEKFSPDTVINNSQYRLDKKPEISNPIKNTINVFKEGQQINYANSILPILNGDETLGQSNLPISQVKDPIKLEINQLANQQINVGHFNKPRNLSSTWNLNNWNAIKSQNLDGESLNQSRALAYKLNHEQEDTLNPQIPAGCESYLNPEFINSYNPISARNSMNMINFNGVSQANSPLKESNASSQFIDLNCRNSILEEVVNKENSQINHSKNIWNSENIQNPSLRDVQRQWDTVNYVSNPITADSQLNWEHNSLEGELEPQQNVPNLQILEHESVDNVKTYDTQSLKNNKSQDIAKETQNLSSNTVKLSKLHARTANIKNIKTSIVNLEKQVGELSESNLDTSNIKNTEQKLEKNESAETDFTQTKLDSTLKNASDNENVDNGKLKKILDNSLEVKAENLKVEKNNIRGNDKIQNSLDNVNTNNPDVTNLVENPNECDQKEKVSKSIRSSGRQRSEKSKVAKLQLNSGINVNVDDIMVCDAPLTLDNKDSEDDQYLEIQKPNRNGKQRNKLKVIQSKEVRSYYDIPWKKNWNTSKQHIKNRIVSKVKKRKMVPPINITIAMKNLFNRVSPAEVTIRNSSSLDSDGSFKFRIELKDKLAKFHKRSIENLISKNETIVRNLKNK